MRSDHRAYQVHVGRQRALADHEDGQGRQVHHRAREACPAARVGLDLHRGPQELPVVPAFAVGPVDAPKEAGTPAAGPADVEEW